jgi:hypothetical protein
MLSCQQTGARQTLEVLIDPDRASYWKDLVPEKQYPIDLPRQGAS